MLSNVTRNLRDVQGILLSMFSANTILIGHSLESDLKALKIIHSVVVDTSVLFPHKMGPPKKRALKTLCGDYLKRIIQENGKIIYISIWLFPYTYSLSDTFHLLLRCFLFLILILAFTILCREWPR